MKMFGIGLTLAVLVDAFLIRSTLVPAFMRLAGQRQLVGAGAAAPVPRPLRHQRARRSRRRAAARRRTSDEHRADCLTWWGPPGSGRHDPHACPQGRRRPPPGGDPGGGRRAARRDERRVGGVDPGDRGAGRRERAVDLPALRGQGSAAQRGVRRRVRPAPVRHRRSGRRGQRSGRRARPGRALLHRLRARAPRALPAGVHAPGHPAVDPGDPRGADARASPPRRFRSPIRSSAATRSPARRRSRRFTTSSPTSWR